ncbi:hypothetical protein Avbf_19092 [Armadillidium vulgare]|nr:hypothetical protein Avbf_19092 [Armadillidium vulgare]
MSEMDKRSGKSWKKDREEREKKKNGTTDKIESEKSTKQDEIVEKAKVVVAEEQTPKTEAEKTQDENIVKQNENQSKMRRKKKSLQIK